MMKNTEWGAVAYLQHSAYGSAMSVRQNNNSDYLTGYQANAEPTCGYTKTNEECNRYCNDNTCNTPYPNSVLASTTNNISGIFDMSGGSWEYVMAIMLDEQGTPMSGRNSTQNSGFNGHFGCPSCDNNTSGLIELTDGYEWPEKKYFEKYSFNTLSYNYQSRILGDATGEMGTFEKVIYMGVERDIGSWYSDFGTVVVSDGPLLARGTWVSGYSTGTDAGMASFAYTYGQEDVGGTFRLVLTP